MTIRDFYDETPASDPEWRGPVHKKQVVVIPDEETDVDVNHG